jgi:hypothetical protein
MRRLRRWPDASRKSDAVRARAARPLTQTSRRLGPAQRRDGRFCVLVLHVDEIEVGILGSADSGDLRHLPIETGSFEFKLAYHPFAQALPFLYMEPDRLLVQIRGHTTK